MDDIWIINFITHTAFDANPIWKPPIIILERFGWDQIGWYMLTNMSCFGFRKYFLECIRNEKSSRLHSQMFQMSRNDLTVSLLQTKNNYMITVYILIHLAVSILLRVGAGGFSLG